MTTTPGFHRIPDEDVRPGMTLRFMGKEHFVASVDPYEHPTVPQVFAMARSASGFAISLCRGGRTQVWRNQ